MGKRIKTLAALFMLTLVLGTSIVATTGTASAHTATPACAAGYRVNFRGWHYASFRLNECATLKLEDAYGNYGWVSSLIGAAIPGYAAGIVVAAINSLSGYVKYLDNRCGNRGVNVFILEGKAFFYAIC